MVAAALTVRELIEILSEAPMDGRVLFFDAHADEWDADVVAQVDIQQIEWTHGTGQVGNEKYDCHYPGPPDAHGTAIVQTVERVVVLSPGPTNLRFYKAKDY